MPLDFQQARDYLCNVSLSSHTKNRTEYSHVPIPLITFPMNNQEHFVFNVKRTRLKSELHGQLNTHPGNMSTTDVTRKNKLKLEGRQGEREQSVYRNSQLEFTLNYRRILTGEKGKCIDRISLVFLSCPRKCTFSILKSAKTTYLNILTQFIRRKNASNGEYKAKYL